MVASPFFSLYKLNGAIVARRVKRANPIFRRGFRASNLDGDIAHVRNYLSSYTGCQLFLFSFLFTGWLLEMFSEGRERKRERRYNFGTIVTIMGAHGQVSRQMSDARVFRGFSVKEFIPRLTSNPETQFLSLLFFQRPIWFVLLLMAPFSIPLSLRLSLFFSPRYQLQHSLLFIRALFISVYNEIARTEGNNAILSGF